MGAYLTLTVPHPGTPVREIPKKFKMRDASTRTKWAFGPADFVRSYNPVIS
jgi:hypothetical protein